GGLASSGSSRWRIDGDALMPRHLPVLVVLLVILANLPAADEPKEVVAPRRFSLDGRERTLKETAELVSRQTNIPLDLRRAEAERKLALKLDAVPFWDGLERVARAAGHRVAVSRQGSKVELLPGARPIPVAAVGAFRVVAKGVTARIDLESGRRSA